jgi:protein-S-isoprenylcysteine O-methyltransferase Ste14
MWLGFLGYWLLASRQSKPVAWSEPISRQLRHWLFFVLAGFFIMPFPPVWAPFARPFIPYDPLLVPFGAVVVAAGFGFSIWARRRLGRDWSDTVALKQDHTLVDTGPYRFVRHPIYSGIALAFLGTAISRDEWRCLLATALVSIGFLLRGRSEEERLRSEIDGYDSYAASTKRFIPWVY